MAYDPAFPDRPQTEDFDLMSEAVSAIDRAVDSGVDPEDIFALAGVASRSVTYMAAQRAMRAGIVPDKDNIQTAAAWVDGFVVGAMFARLRDSQDGARRKATLK